ncbi:MAG: bifunctional oligoribonuclease/PAP phosphatase NrnA [Candidatus Cryosericum sp.]|jgi:phosphoesterase RecJ-like protein|nr:bifunctional oligoribonuclease/PAP phosphatase NrnA [Caldisericota bacterium]
MRGTGLDAIAWRIRAASDVFLFTHEFADGDALGSVVALTLYLQAMGKTVHAFVPGQIQSVYRFLATDELLNTMPAVQAAAHIGTAHVTCLSADAADVDRLGEWKSLFLSGAEHLVIDHHETNAGFGEVFAIDGSASSCCEVLFDLFNLIDPQLIDARIASALYTGLVADTGSFQYANTRALSLVHGAQLVELGASPDEISRCIYESKPYGSVWLMAASVAASRLMYGGQVVVSYVTRTMLEDSGALDEDTEGITDELRRIAGTKAVVLFKEASDGSVKVSFRGKYGFDVKRIATAFGGGGHVLAAGCTITSDLGEAEVRILAELDRYLGPSRT